MESVGHIPGHQELQQRLCVLCGFLVVFDACLALLQQNGPSPAAAVFCGCCSFSAGRVSHSLGAGTSSHTAARMSVAVASSPPSPFVPENFSALPAGENSAARLPHDLPADGITSGTASAFPAAARNSGARLSPARVVTDAAPSGPPALSAVSASGSATAVPCCPCVSRAFQPVASLSVSSPPAAADGPLSSAVAASSSCSAPALGAAGPTSPAACGGVAALAAAPAATTPTCEAASATAAEFRHPCKAYYGPTGPLPEERRSFAAIPRQRTMRGRGRDAAQRRPSGRDSMMESFEQLQAAYVQQKAAIVRASIEAVCSQEASMLAFSRTVATHLKWALSSPVVVACAYDNETEELYCCFASPPLHLLKAAEASAAASAAPQKEGSHSPASSPRLLGGADSSGSHDEAPAAPWPATRGDPSVVGKPAAGTNAVALPAGGTAAPPPATLGIAPAAANRSSGVAAASSELPVGARRAPGAGETTGCGDRMRGGAAGTGGLPSISEPHAESAPANNSPDETAVHAALPGQHASSFEPGPPQVVRGADLAARASGTGETPTPGPVAEETRQAAPTATPTPENSEGGEQAASHRRENRPEECADAMAAAGGPPTAEMISAVGAQDAGAPLSAVAAVEEGCRRGGGRYQWTKETGKDRHVHAWRGLKEGGRVSPYHTDRAIFPAFPYGGGRRSRTRSDGRGSCIRSSYASAGDKGNWLRFPEIADDNYLAHQLLQFLRRRFREDKEATDSVVFIPGPPSPSADEQSVAEVVRTRATPAAAPPGGAAPAAATAAGLQTAAATATTGTAAAVSQGAGSSGGGDARQRTMGSVEATTAAKLRRGPDDSAAEQQRDGDAALQSDAAGDEKLSRRQAWVFSLDSGCIGRLFWACREAPDEARACWYDPREDRLLLSSSAAPVAAAAFFPPHHAFLEEWLGEPSAPDSHQAGGRLASQQQQQQDRRAVGRRGSVYSARTAAADIVDARDSFFPYIRVTRASLESNGVNRSSCFSQRTSWESIPEASSDGLTPTVWSSAAAAASPPGVGDAHIAAAGETRPPFSSVSRKSAASSHEGTAAPRGPGLPAAARGAAGGRATIGATTAAVGMAVDAAAPAPPGGASRQPAAELLPTGTNSRSSLSRASDSRGRDGRSSSRGSSVRGFGSWTTKPRRSWQFSTGQEGSVANHVIEEGMAGRKRVDASSFCLPGRRGSCCRPGDYDYSAAVGFPAASSTAGTRDSPTLEENIPFFKSEEQEVEAGGDGDRAPLRVLVRPLVDRSGSSRLWQRVKAGRIDYASSQGWGRKLTATSLSSALQGGSSNAGGHTVTAAGEEGSGPIPLSKHSGEKSRPSWAISSRPAGGGPRPRDGGTSNVSSSSSVSAATAGSSGAGTAAGQSAAAAAPLRARPPSRSSAEEGGEAGQSEESRRPRSRSVFYPAAEQSKTPPLARQQQLPRQHQQQRVPPLSQAQQQQPAADQQVQLPLLLQQEQRHHHQGTDTLGQLQEEGGSLQQRSVAGAGSSHLSFARPVKSHAENDESHKEKQTTEAAAGDSELLSRITPIKKVRDSVSSRRSSVSRGLARDHSPRLSACVAGERRRSVVRRPRSVASSSRSSSVRPSRRPTARGRRTHGDSLSSRGTAAEEGGGPEQQQQCYPLGLLVCMEPQLPETDGLQLLDAIGAAVEPLLLHVLEVEWLRRECTKKALQLELHRTVFQDSANVMRKVERLLALVHTTISAEQVAFFIVDSQNSAFVCLGGALQARGLSLPFTHPLLGEALRQNGRIVIANDVPSGLNEAYDCLAHVNTRAVIVVPLMDGQGHVKALLLVVNRSVCTRLLLSRGGCRSLCASLAAAGSSPRPETGASGSGYTRSPLMPSSSSSDSGSTSTSLDEGNKERGGGATTAAGASGPLEDDGRRSSSYKPAGGRGSFSCNCPACSISERKRLIYGDLLQTASISNVLKVAHKFTREDEVLLRCVQREIQNALGGALTNMCMAGMTLLNPKKTMISYVIAEPDEDYYRIRPGRSADKMLEEIESIVEEDKRLKFQSLRRCQSMAVGLRERESSCLFGGSWRGRSVDCVRRRGKLSSSEEEASLSSDGRRGSGEVRRELLSWGLPSSAPTSGVTPAAAGVAHPATAPAAARAVASPTPPAIGSPAEAHSDGGGETAAKESPPVRGAAVVEVETAAADATNGAAAGGGGEAAQGEKAAAAGRDAEPAARSRYPRFPEPQGVQQQRNEIRTQQDDRSVPQGMKSQAGAVAETRGSRNAFVPAPPASPSHGEEEADSRHVTSSGGAVRKARTEPGLRLALEEEAEEQEWMRALAPGGSASSEQREEEEGARMEGREKLHGQGRAGRGDREGEEPAAAGGRRRDTQPRSWGIRRRRGVRRSASLPTLVFSGALKKCEKHMRMLRKDMLLAQYRRWDLDIWKRTGGEMEVFFLLAFDDLGLLEWSEETKLRQFFAVIRDGYHTDNPYHNFYHAVHVFQVCWMFIASCGCRHVLSRLEQFSILLAALSHDVDHPGVNNAFLRAELHPLSIMYNDKAVLENHHAAFAVRSMMELNLYGAGEPRAHHSGLGVVEAGQTEPEEERKSEAGARLVPSFTELRRLVIQAIFSTDMELFRHHHDAMKRRAQMKKSDREMLQGEEDRALLVMCLIHCADICNPVTGGGRNVQWASLVTQEFNAQVDLERRKGVAISVFMDARTEVERIQSQIGFLSYVVLDQFRALADLLPEVEVLVQQGEKNLEAWQAALEAVTSAEEAKRKGLACKEPVSNFRFRLKDLKFSGMQGPKCFGFIRSQVFDGYRPPSLDD